MKCKIAVLFATWFGSGLIPPFILKGMAGTYGSFFSIPLCILALALSGNSIIFFFAIIFLIFFVGLWCIPIAEVALGSRTDWHGKKKTRDQNQIVIDETLGILITCLPFAIWHFGYDWKSLAIAFSLFRFFDIAKPPPARFFDKMKDATGVMMDDAVAGIYAGTCLTFYLKFSGY